MAEILNDLKLAALNISGTSNASPQATHKNGSLIVSANATLNPIDSGKIVFLERDDDGAVTVTLPDTADLSLGARYTLVQTDAIDADDSIVIQTGGSPDILSTGSFATNSDNIVKPDASDTKLTATGADTDCQHGPGSVIDCQVVGQNRWLFQVNSRATGAGANNTYVFS